MRVPLAVQSVSEDKRLQHYPKKYRQKEAKCQEELLQKEIDGLIIRDSCRKR